MLDVSNEIIQRYKFANKQIVENFDKNKIDRH